MARDHGENCDCMTTVDTKLREYNTRLAISILIEQKALVGRPTILTEQITKGRGMPKAMAVTPSYCPFCGTKYGDLNVEETKAEEAPDGNAEAQSGRDNEHAIDGGLRPSQDHAETGEGR